MCFSKGFLTHFDVNVEAVILKKTDLASDAKAFARSVFPFPGGPKSNKPLAGAQSPWKS